jgi:hypothetical protein
MSAYRSETEGYRACIGGCLREIRRFALKSRCSSVLYADIIFRTYKPHLVLLRIDIVRSLEFEASCPATYHREGISRISSS